MSAILLVRQPGLHTTVQDLGRTGAQRLGIPVSGALDSTALRVANVVVGNPPATAGLEMVGLGPTLEVETGSARVALAGAAATLIVETGDGARREVGGLQSVRIVAGDRIRIGAVSRAAVAYLAIEGGFDVPLFLGSRSTYARGVFGGFEGRSLRPGDRLRLIEAAADPRPEQQLLGVEFPPAQRVRVILGPQDDYFTAEAIATFLSRPYTVSREADRMGLRLEGEPLAHAKGYNIVSDGIAPGAIQVPGSGQPIVLLADRQTTGGYPKIATVISADLPALGRVLPGMTLHFEAISIQQAEKLRRAEEAWLQSLSSRLTPVRAEGLDLERLLDANLISGVVDAIRPSDM